MAKIQSYKNESRLEWSRTTEENEALKPNEVMLGAVLRIADAVEKMAANYGALIEARDRYKLWYENERVVTIRLERSNAALRGVIKKLKKGKS